MWLINTATRDLEFVQNPKKGSYAILSHTWGACEVSFQQYPRRKVPVGADEKGLAKIDKMCELALERGLPYTWVDTCCIDKTSSAELSEAINSMFQWYRGAAVCFAYLSDLSPDVRFADGFPNCNWLKRGWTLQELIAPRNVEFYDQTWNLISTKAKSSELISRCSGVDLEVLEDSTNLSQIPVARRMSWVSMRKTTRVEDLSYCMMGIFDIHMPMIYGEGKRAFIRLQEEIAKQSCDMSLFAWTAVPPDDDDDERDDWTTRVVKEQFRGILARSPREFSTCRNLKPRNFGSLFEREFTITNKGIRIETALVESRSSQDAILNLGVCESNQGNTRVTDGWMGVYLTKTPIGFVRCRPDARYTAGGDKRWGKPRETIHIRKDINATDQASLENRFRGSVILRRMPRGCLLGDFMPSELWDFTRLMFVNQNTGINIYLLLNITPDDTASREGFQAIVGCSTMGGATACRVWTEQDAAFAEALRWMTYRKELFDYVAFDYFRRKFIRSEQPHLNESTAVFRGATGSVVGITVKLTIGEYEGASVYYLDVSNEGIS